MRLKSNYLIRVLIVMCLFSSFYIFGCTNYKQKGYNYLKSKNYEKAVNSLLKAKELYPNDSHTYNRLGWAYYYLAQYDNAIIHFLKSNEIKESGGNHQGLGYSYSKISEDEKALTHFLKFKELQPSNPIAYYKLGWTYYRLEKYEQGITHFKKSNSIKENYYNHLGIGRCYSKLEDYESAAVAFEKALDTAQTDEDRRAAKIGWANIYIPQGNYQKAYDILGTIPYLGINFKTEKGGILIKDVLKGGPADYADLRPGDLLTHFDGITLENVTRKVFLYDIIAMAKYGSQVGIQIKRDGVSIANNLSVGIKPDMANIAIDNEQIKTTANTTSGNRFMEGMSSASNINQDAIAVVIGNKNYFHKDIPTVEYADNDAFAIRKYLIDALGYKDGNIIFESNTTKAKLEMIFGIKSDHRGVLFNYTKPEKSDVFIYYSGHGSPDPNNNRAYLLPTDCNPTMMSLTAYPLDVLYENLPKINAKSITVVLEACFSGGTNTGKWLVQNASPALIKIDTPLIIQKNITIFTSSKNNQVSSWYPEKQHGMFTYFFLNAVTGKADFNHDGQITHQEIYDFVADNAEGVPYYAKRLHGGRMQTPTMHTANKDAVFVKY